MNEDQNVIEDVKDLIAGKQAVKVSIEFEVISLIYLALSLIIAGVLLMYLSKAIKPNESF